MNLPAHIPAPPALASDIAADTYRLAFADPEFMQRPELIGVRLELEMLKPELELREQQIHHTIVVYGSARVPSPEAAQQILQQAQSDSSAHTADIAALTQRLQRSTRWYEAARQFARLVARYSRTLPAKQRLYICTGAAQASWKRPIVVHTT